jgi:hypothetical protein
MLTSLWTTPRLWTAASASATWASRVSGSGRIDPVSRVPELRERTDFEQLAGHECPVLVHPGVVARDQTRVRDRRDPRVLPQESTRLRRGDDLKRNRPLEAKLLGVVNVPPEVLAQDVVDPVPRWGGWQLLLGPTRTAGDDLLH